MADIPQGRPVVDTDALADYFHDEGYCRPWEDHSQCDCRDRALSMLVNGPVTDAADVRRQTAEDIAAAIEQKLGETSMPDNAASRAWTNAIHNAARIAREAGERP